MLHDIVVGTMGSFHDACPMEPSPEVVKVMIVDAQVEVDVTS